MRTLRFFLVLASLAACDHGLAPPERPLLGTIRGTVTYVDTTAWPPPDSLLDLRFVAMRFIPRDTSDFLQLNRLTFSPEPLARYVARDTFVVEDVEAGTFVYSGVAQHYASDLLAWRPVGLYEDNGGVFDVNPGDVAEIAITVDFRNLPPFPPPQ